MDVMIDASRRPVVFEKDGEVFANSRDVAAYFDKHHRHVLEVISGLIVQEPKLGSAEFSAHPYIEPQNGQTYRSYNMTRDGFTLLAMGFTGPKALKWKLKYIEAFNAMEAEMRRLSAPAVPDLSDPVLLRQLLLENATKRIEAEQKAVALEAKVEDMQEDVAAHERLTKADGSLNITETAKNLGMRPKDLFDWLAHNGWIYKRPNSGTWLGYQTKCNYGLLEHKTTTVLRADGSEKITEQVRVTAKGLSALAKLLQPAARLIA